MKDYRTRAAAPDPEELIDFTELYDTHRAGFYRGWLIIQPFDEMDGEILCYLPCDEWENGGFDSLEYLKGYYAADWEAGNLIEAVDFINSFEGDF
jgi:hypothetical protein